MLPTPLSSFWFSSALLMGVLRLRNSFAKSSNEICSGSKPGAANFSITLNRPKRRGSTKRSSRPVESFRIACVCFSIRNFRRRNAEAAGHSEVDDPLTIFSRRAVRRSQIENDVLAHSPHAGDGLRFEPGNDLFSGRLSAAPVSIPTKRIRLRRRRRAYQARGQ